MDHSSWRANSGSSSPAPVPSMRRNRFETPVLSLVIFGSLNQSPSVCASTPPGLSTLCHSETTLRGSGTVQSM